MNQNQRILVIAPHPDDEVLGAGGLMLRAKDEGADVFVVLVTKADAAHFNQDMYRAGRREAAQAHAFIGVNETIELEFPAAEIDTVPHRELNAEFERVLREVNPDTLLVPFCGDIHRDHQLIFESALVAARPHRPGAPRNILAYETLSETNWNAPFLTPAFQPNTFVDISNHLERKLEAMRIYASQLMEFPHERSLEAIGALATLRGAHVGLRAAEAFVSIRTIC